MKISRRETLHAKPVPVAPVGLPPAARLASLLDCGPKGTSRNRKLPAALTLALSVQQCLTQNRSYHSVLAAYGSEMPHRDLPTESAYSQARSRLSTGQIDSAAASLASHFARAAPSFLEGRGLLALDAVDFSVEDTDENRETWTYPSGQKPDFRMSRSQFPFPRASDTMGPNWSGWYDCGRFLLKASSTISMSLSVMAPSEWHITRL